MKKKKGQEKTGFIKTTSNVKQMANKKNMRTDIRQGESLKNRKS